MTNNTAPSRFADLGLPEFLLETVAQLGYETPSPIQVQTIPILLQGQDLMGQAQTGTGKTAAFALPILAHLDTRDKNTQALVLTPTRELAIQVAEACQTYARNLHGFHVVPIYGGAGYSNQLKQLRSGAQMVVGTPGRVMDHMRKGSLKLNNLKTLVLDEADEMLRMGFIDDVEWILEQTPGQRQIALFSATMPREIQQVAGKHLRKPHTIKIASKTSTAPAISQRYWPVAGLHKLDALTRILEVETIDGAIVFVRTKVATAELAEKLVARGFAAEALNGDMAQAQREKTVDKMRKGRLDILVATDVAARGLDIPRISHVINYDIPFDTEAYVHRIGRTGRAGRPGEAILFVANREHRMLKAIERSTKQPIAIMNLPTEQDINAQRVERFKQKIADTLEKENLDFYRELLGEYQESTQTPAIEIAAALARLAQGDASLLLQERKQQERKQTREQKSGETQKPGAKTGRHSADERLSAQGKQRKKRQTLEDSTAKPLKDFPDVKMERFRLAVGYADNVRPGHIVGAIANEADIDSAYIGHIEIFDDFTTVDLPADMPKETFQHLKKVWVCQRPLNISRMNDERPSGRSKTAQKRPAKKRSNESRVPRKSSKPGKR
ncbi:MAG: DEAD/DEAH box helicase [Cellvibrionaceae bacterium]